MTEGVCPHGAPRPREVTGVKLTRSWLLRKGQEFLQREERFGGGSCPVGHGMGVQPSKHGGVRSIMILGQVERVNQRTQGLRDCGKSWRNKIILCLVETILGFQVVLVVKNPPAEARDIRDAGQILGQEDPLEEDVATHSSILAWGIPWTEEPGGIQSTGSQRVRHN